MTSGNTFWEGNTIKLAVEFRVGGILKDPTDVILRITSPNGTAYTYTYGNAEITRTSEGCYNKEVLMDIPGKWPYEYEGTGAAKGTKPDVVKIKASPVQH